MIEIICRVCVQVNHESLDMRIGLHCGSFVGGVIGTARVRFDIWGEDVLLGNSIESEGTAGRICASNEAKQVLEKCPVGPHLTFSFKKEFELVCCLWASLRLLCGRLGVRVVCACVQ